MKFITIKNNQAFTTSLTIAEGTDKQHKNVLETIRKNISDFESFGRVTFETRTFKTPGGNQRQEYALLNERQATLLFTYMRNNDKVKAFKIRLVQEFYRMAENERQQQLPLGDHPLLNPAIVEFINNTANDIAIKARINAVKHLTNLALERHKEMPDDDLIAWVKGFEGLVEPVVFTKKDLHILTKVLGFAGQTIQESIEKIESGHMMIAA